MEPKVLLVYPPPQNRPDELCRTDGSLGLTYLAASLERADIEVDILDASVGPVGKEYDNVFDTRLDQPNGLIRVGMSTEQISEVIARGKYNVVAFSSIFTPQTSMALEVAKAAKAVSRDILVITGGVNARALPEYFLNSGNVDAVCTTEGERVIVELIEAYRNGEPLTVPGTISKVGDGFTHNHLLPGYVLNGKGPDCLDALPIPAWEKLPWERYDQVDAAGRCFHKNEVRSATIMTSRGCPFECAFCHISIEKTNSVESGGIGALRMKSVGRVIEELEELVRLGVKSVFFEDDSLLAKKSRVIEIFNRVKDMGLRIADVNGVNLTHFLKGGRNGPVIDVEYMELLHEAGFEQIVFPVESATQDMLNRYASKKLNHAKLDVVELVEKAVEIGIVCPINMMMGFPDETEEQMLDSIELGKRLVDAGAEYCSYKVVVPFPGSVLYEDVKRRGMLNDDFHPDDYSWRKAVMKDTTVAPERIEELCAIGTEQTNSDEFKKERLLLETGGRWQAD